MTDSMVDQATDTRRTALGTLLVEREYLDQGQLDDALRIGEETGERLGEVIVRLGWVSEDDLAKVLAEQWHLRYFERSAISFDGRALRRMTREDAARLEALPIQESEDGVILVALAEPTEARLDALRTLLGDRIDFVVVAKTAIETGLRSELLTPGTNGHGEEQANVGQFQRPDEPEAETPVEHVAAEPEEIASAITASVASQIDALRSVVTDVDAKRDQAEQEVVRLGGELGQTQGELGRIQGELGQTKDEVGRLQGEVARLEGELSSRHQELTDRTDTLRSMQQTLREYADALDSHS
jgi:hypothetical protein